MAVKFHLLFWALWALAVAPDKIRLSGGAHSCVGRLEVYHSNEWGIVCARKPNEATAKVVCRQLRCGNVEEMNVGFSFGQDPPHKVWLDDVSCHGSESSLFQCSSVNWGVHECNLKTDHFNINCSEHIKVSLADGADRCAGRVEIAYQGRNGTICPKNWGQLEADLVCREVGCGEALSFGRGAVFGPGAGPVWIDDLSCAVHDKNIWECGRMMNRKCKDEEKAASVVCADHIEVRLAGREDACSGTLEVRKGKDLLSTCPPEIDLTDPDKLCEKLRCGNATSSRPINCTGSNLTCSGRVHVSLVDSHCYGTVRINHTGQEGAVCSNNWDLKAGTVVCKSVGCGKAVSVYSTQGRGPVFLDYLRCNGNEKHLWHCGALRPTQENCQHAAVICSDSVKTRLMDGHGPCAGRVEVFYRGEWGRVCNTDWDTKDSNVVCAELNCGEVLSFHQAPIFRSGQGRGWRSKVHCSSTETSLRDCPGGTDWDQDYCSHNQEVGVVCGEHKKLQLANGTSCSGAVEIFSRGSWMGLSGASWEQNAAQVVCRQLHCGNAVSKEVKALGSGEVWSHWFNCSSTEDNVFRCQAEKVAKSDPEKDSFAYVNCSGSVSVNLTGSEDRCAGLVEVCLEGSCGSVCGRDWSTKESEVVCQELGCGKVVEMLDDFTVPSENTQPLLDFVRCTGNESFLAHCNLLKVDSQQCQKSNAKVICSDSIKPRLVGDEGRCAGTVEAYHSGRWWSVCDQNWSKEAGDVVCRELGCGLAVKIHRGAYYGPGSGQGWVNVRACQGSKDSFSQCISPGKGQQCAGQAGVRCSEHREIRLQGPEPCSGRVILHYNDSWSPMCSDQWGQSQADQLCQHMRCGKTKSVHNDTTLQRYSKWLRLQPCTESNPWDCPLEHANCTGKTAQVSCTDTVKATLSEKCSGQVRLARNGQNERVCGGNWGMTQARVLCRELDCGTALWTVWDSRHQDNNTLDATVDHVRCNGGESLLWKCRALSIPPKTCSAANDITVVCAAGFKARLSEHCGGRLQVNLRGTWEDACPVNSKGGDLVCKELGCGTMTKTQMTTVLTSNVSRPYLNCTQESKELWQCATQKTCRLQEHTFVYCSEYRAPFNPLPLILAFVVILAVLILVYPLVRLYKWAVVKINAMKRASKVSDSISDYEEINASDDEQPGTELKRLASSERRERSDEEDSQDQDLDSDSSFTGGDVNGDVDVEKGLSRLNSDKEDVYDDVSASLDEVNPDEPANLQWERRDQEGYPPPPDLDTQVEYDDVEELLESGHSLSEHTRVGDLGQTAGGDGETLDGTGDPDC
ncbi:scavenger receptor cysteine-rich type 1 protein M130-like [Huso huso]|uniref:Scavenger receptor cysteine-rich type 1 protein M130-like n=1 Tax=Huso huso TaxID=61971 RepID=A0ABR0Y2I9_HUSHU